MGIISFQLLSTMESWTKNKDKVGPIRTTRKVRRCQMGERKELWSLKLIMKEVGIGKM